MRQKITIIILLVSAHLSAAVTLDECRTWAHDHYPELAQYQLIEQTAAYTVRTASMGWIPRLNLSAQVTYQSAVANMTEVWNELGVGDILAMQGKEIPELEMQKLQGKVQLDIQQTIWDGGASVAQKRIAKAEAVQQMAQIDVDFRALEDRIDNLYFGILLLDEQARQMDDMQQLLQANLDRVTTLYTNDMALQSDVDAIQVEILSLQQKQSEVRNSRRAYRTMMSVFCGRDLTAEELVEPSVIRIQPANSSNPSYALLDASEKVLDAQEKALWVSAMPQIGAFASGWYGYPGLDMFKAMTSEDWTLNGMVGVKFNWAIDRFYTIPLSRKKISSSREQLTVQRNMLDFNEQMKSIERNAQQQRYEDAMSADEEIVRLRTSVRKAAEVKYENGTITTADLLKTLTDEQSARSTMAIHRINYIKTLYENK